MGSKIRVFVSSSADLFQARDAIDQRLRRWFDQTWLADDVEPYLWERELEGGLLLSVRQPVQDQIPDPKDWSIPFTICIFGERIGVPLSDDLRSEWKDRLSSWLATDDAPGLRHPWPKTPSEEAECLKRGEFPLTGTVFELISACDVPEEYRNLVVGYSASRTVETAADIHQVFFNREREKKRIREKGRSPEEQDAFEKAEYEPQVQALFNFLKYLREQKMIEVPCYAGEQEMTRKVLRRAEHDLRKHFNVESENNPFKLSLTHFGVDDTNELPGRRLLVSEATSYMKKSGNRPLVLITGPSGCGKSSLLQRGVLGKLQDEGIQVLAVRPDQLEDQTDADRLDLLWDLICERIDGCRLGKIAKHKRDQKMADHMKDVLERRDLKFAIGLDQFEEMLDEMQAYSDKIHRQRGWWLMMRFLKAIAASDRVMIYATLESSREKTFEDLKIETITGMPWVTVEADVGPNEIAQIAVDGFERGGFELDTMLVQEIKNKWKHFVDSLGTATGNASLLPLAALWMAQLYQKFEDMAAPPVATGTALVDALKDASQDKPTLTLDDIGGKRAVDFKGVVGRLADQAWRDAFRKAPPTGPVEEDLQAYRVLSGVFDTLIALDGGRMRLISGPDSGTDKYVEKLYLRFAMKRLLVPAGRNDRVRLVHQAIVDHWAPAREWYRWRKDYLELEQKMRRDALDWYENDRPALTGDQSVAQAAAKVLDTNSGQWAANRSEPLSVNAEALRAYCCELLQHASDLSEVIETSSIQDTIAHVAARYHLIDILRVFLDRDPTNLYAVNGEGGTLMRKASLINGTGVKTLLEHARSLNDTSWPRLPDSGGFQPIAMAIQEYANDNFVALLSIYKDPNEAVVSDGRTMLHIAAMVDNLQAATTLLSQENLDPEKTTIAGSSALDVAAYRGSERVFDLLLPTSSIPSNERQHPLHLAAQNNQAKIIRRFMESEIVDEDQREAALIHKPDEFPRTPLMEAALYRQPEALRELLNYCDATEPIHRTENGMTLLHLALWHTEAELPTEDEQHRAKQCVELLTTQTKLDVMALAMGKTAYEMGETFRDARRVLRKHMPFDYGSMDEALKKEDLLSTNPRDHRRILNGAPQILRDKFGDKNGLDLLIDAKRTTTLAYVLGMENAPVGMIRQRWAELIRLASGADQTVLRRAVLQA